MMSFTPITLLGDNLGQRHRYLNSLVRKAKESGTSFQDVEPLPEQSPIDRLFKIDLASELEHVDYIIRSLKDDDMLFVSRALKAKWLLDHHDIINPKYLEDVLFPELVTPAVAKIKHWITLNLRDPTLCQEFYQHYKKKTFEFAIKFLSHCSHDYILGEVPKILSKLSPHHLKVLCEKCPEVAKIYFDSLTANEDVKTRYLGQEKSFYNSVKCVLKLDADAFLDITEKYFSLNSFGRFSPLATDYILSHHKTRFTNKLELYTAYFLHIPTLAARLSVEECQEVVIKLARANYLQHWFQYKNVESLIKRLSPDKRAAFKKRVFVEKDVGERVQEWPYVTPKSPPHSDSDPHVFDDENNWQVCEYPNFRHMLKKRKYARFECVEACMPIKSELERLFDEFRFVGFDRALHDLGQRIRAAGSTDRRRDIFLVLVSKSGGRNDAVSALLRLAVRHSNEPPHTRASVLRSLVKRANVWRLPADAWQNLLDFGHSLGLDGVSSEVTCIEGLHAVVIRQLLSGECEQTIRVAFFKNFSSLAEYSLQSDERVLVAIGLQNILAAAATDVETAVAAERLDQLLDVIEKYCVRINTASQMVEAVQNLALRDTEVAIPVLKRLYKAKIGRRELLRVNLKFLCDQGALINALRHDPLAIELEQIADMIANGHLRLDEFISKIVVYFNQEQDFTIRLSYTLKEKIAQKHNTNCKKEMARSLARLLYKDFEMELRKLDAAGKEHVTFAAALRACAHLARPPVNLIEWGWRKAGVKAVATRAIRSCKVERIELIRSLAAERRTVRVALALSMSSAGALLLDTFASAANLRPVIALQVALAYIHHHGECADPRVWDIIKPLLCSVNLSTRERLRRLLGKTDWIPSGIKPDYCGTLYLVIDKIPNSRSEYVLNDLCMLLPEVSDNIIENILLRVLEKKGEDKPALPFPAIFVRYLMLSRNDEDFERRFAMIGDQFLERLDNLRCKKNSGFKNALDEIIKSLKYNAAFLNSKYTSCLSVIQRILTWMHKFMPKEEYFEKYVQIHLTMLYLKAIRQSMKHMPEVFADPEKKKSEGVEVVAFIFGRYIVKEVKELACTYFDSIIELYTSALVDYLSANFMYGISRAKFIEYVLKGLLKDGVGIQRRMAVYVFRDLRYDIKDITRKEIEEVMLQDKAIEIFVAAELLN